MQAPPISEDEMQQLLEWIDAIPFSRPKKNLSRDFADGVLMAEIMKQYYPTLVQLHNYPAASALNAKFSNWKTLNDKVFRKLKFTMHANDIQSVITVEPGAVERVLFLVLTRIRSAETQRGAQISAPPSQVSMDHSRETQMISAQLAEKEDAIRELRTTIEMLESKMRRMEELNRLKDAKIESLIRKLEEGIN